MYSRILHYWRVFSILLALLTLNSCAYGPDSFLFDKETHVDNGILDLREWNPDDNPVVKLDGQWEFYWNQLFTPEDSLSTATPVMTGYMELPGIWNSFEVDGTPLPGAGYATFRMRIELPDKGGLYALKITEMETAYRVWVNGKFLMETGVIGTSKDTMVPSWKRNEGVFECHGDSVEIVMEMSNFHHRKGGPEEVILFGHAEDILRYTAYSHGLQYFLFGIILIMGLYHLVVYLYRRSNRTALYFAIVCGIIALRTTFGGEKLFTVFFPSLSWDVLIHIGYISFLSMLPAVSLFYHSLFMNRWSRVIMILTFITSGGMILGVLVLPPSVFSWFPIPYQITAVIFMVYLLVELVVRVIKKEDGAVLLLAGSLFLVISAVNDIIYNNIMINTSFLFPLGMSGGVIVLIFTHSAYLAGQFSHAYTTAEDLTHHLELRVRERTKELHEGKVRLEKLAREDSLTGLLNRRSSLARLQEEFDRFKRYNIPFTVAILDIDFFKKVNDTYGHLAGDMVIRGVATILTECLRSLDVVGRYGGEEFVVVLTGTESNGAMSAIEKIREAVASNQWTYNNDSIQVTCSIGFATIDGDINNYNELLSCADEALYRAKSNGRNRVECAEQNTIKTGDA